MVKDYSKSIVILVMLNVVAYLIHHFFIIPGIQSKIAPEVNIQVSYLINAVISLGLCAAILVLKNSFKDQVGFIFLGLSVLKMILLFVVLNPTNNMGEVTKADALAFFIPFGLNLVLEQIFIVKLLKISDLAKEFHKK